ncbi:Adaptive-response sensory-kinase SasA [subsurface metagenome]
MAAANKTKDQLILELMELRKRTSELLQWELDHRRVEEEIRRQTHELGERLKELNCLYGLSNLVMQPGITLEEILQGLLALIINAWQYPEITCARISLTEGEFRSENFRDTQWKQARDIVVQGERIGVLEVYYLEERPESFKGPFLKEERSLLNAITSRVSQIIERMRGEEELKRYRHHLEELVNERTSKMQREMAERKLKEKELRETEEKAEIQQEQLIQADKLASLGFLVSGVAHEINNPNHTIMSNAELVINIWKGIGPILKGYYEENGDFLAGGLNYTEICRGMPIYLKGISDGAKRIDSIVNDLKNFSRQEDFELSLDVNINLAVKSAITLTSNFISRATESFIVEISDNLPKIKGNYQRLEQVVVNLIQNACQALPDKKKAIFVTTSYNKEKCVAEVKVRDEGSGIPQENLVRLKDPFFTTKRSSGGTGLGLSISNTIIEDHHGTLEITSQPGQGTTATISLPVEKAE